MTNAWPALTLSDWRDTRETLHRWTQVVGKIKLALTPLVNHYWNVTLFVTPRGLTTGRMPYGERWLDIEFDFVAHVLRLRVSDGVERTVALAPRTVADFYADVFAALRALNIDVHIWPMPVELVDHVIRLDRDEEHRSYDADAAQRFWRILALTDAVFVKFRARFIGKCSPVHFFWGSFDLAVTRFSGRPAPPNPAADAMTREAYSHEVSSVGFWPGDSRLERAAFYSYAAPEPEGFRTSTVSPSSAYFNAPLGGFYLHYDDLLATSDPDATLLDFCQSTYAAAADRGNWDRAALERS
ncbi:MAG TPA: DUF5996 family protein [Thermoanaerobaculia bacterium]|nr:DUF5996 family protein [Thermoanaerobaculia bacterium]